MFAMSKFDSETFLCWMGGYYRQHQFPAMSKFHSAIPFTLFWLEDGNLLIGSVEEVDG